VIALTAVVFSVLVILCASKSRRSNYKKQQSSEDEAEKSDSMPASENSQNIVGKNIQNPLYNDDSRDVPSPSPVAADATLKPAPESTSSLVTFDEVRNERLAALRAARENNKQKEQQQLEEALNLIDSLDHN
jgi:hypothetical protein